MKKTNYINVLSSKFYAYYFHVENIKEIEEILLKLKKDNKKAKHIVYAYKIGTLQKKYSDKEVFSIGGNEINKIIELKNLDNTLIVIVRYFGGTLLGKGLLSRTYLKCVTRLLDK
ncbi:MAG: YigZ family protein [Bacilli bacterium]